MGQQMKDFEPIVLMNSRLCLERSPLYRLDVVDEVGLALAVAEDEHAPRLGPVQVEPRVPDHVHKNLVVAETGVEFQVAPVGPGQEDEAPVVVEALAQDLYDLREQGVYLVVLADDVADLVDHQGVVVVPVAVLEGPCPSPSLRLSMAEFSSFFSRYSPTKAIARRRKGGRRAQGKDEAALREYRVGGHGQDGSRYEEIADPFPRIRPSIPSTLCGTCRSPLP